MTILLYKDELSLGIYRKHYYRAGMLDGFVSKQLPFGAFDYLTNGAQSPLIQNLRTNYLHN
jgi:hypothetical protein